MPFKIIRIPCKKYIASYLYSKYEANASRPLLIKRNSNLSYYLKTLMTSNYKRNEHRNDLSRYDHELKISINSSLSRYGYRLTNSSISNFNSFMRNQIFEEFRNKVKENIGSGESKEYLAIEFLNQYNISEDELSVDTILRDERRNNSQNS